MAKKKPQTPEVADKSAVERCHEAFALAWDANNFLSSHKRDFAATFANRFSFGAQYAVGRLVKQLSKDFADFPDQWHATYQATEAMPAKPKRVRKKK